jgi:TPR repeat protein
MNNLGSMYRSGQGVPQDYVEAYKWMSLAMARATGENQKRVALARDGVAKLMTPAQIAQAQTRFHEWLRAAADRGDRNAMYTLGSLHRRGEGVPQDHAQAVAWFRKAADLGHVGAMNSLGVRYASGEGEPQDYLQAMAWYRRAADLGHLGAMNNLGLMYYQGKGVPQDYPQAMAWYRKAADLGDAGARGNLDHLRKLMTPAQIAEGERLVREWRNK